MVCLERNDPSVDWEPLRIRLPWPETVDAVVDTVWLLLMLFFERKDEREFFRIHAVGTLELLGNLQLSLATSQWLGPSTAGAAYGGGGGTAGWDNTG